MGANRARIDSRLKGRIDLNQKGVFPYIVNSSRRDATEKQTCKVGCEWDTVNLDRVRGLFEDLPCP